MNSAPKELPELQVSQVDHTPDAPILDQAFAVAEAESEAETANVKRLPPVSFQIAGRIPFPTDVAPLPNEVIRLPALPEDTTKRFVGDRSVEPMSKEYIDAIEQVFPKWPERIPESDEGPVVKLDSDIQREGPTPATTPELVEAKRTPLKSVLIFPDTEDMEWNTADLKRDRNESELVLREIAPISEDTLNAERVEARRIVQKAFADAQRGMISTARQDFLRALYVLASARDAVSGNRECNDALLAAMRALDESSDFRLSAAVGGEPADLLRIASTHKTRILRDEQFKDLSPLIAEQLYQAEAAEKFGAAVAGEPIGSMALYGLAKISQHLAAKDPTNSQEFKDNAVTLHRAAMFAHPKNHLAANEAGVLLTHQGRFAQAESVLQRAVDLAPSQIRYHNLAVVQKRLGRVREASLNEQMANRLAMQMNAPWLAQNANGVVWVSPEEFIGHAPPAVGEPQGPAQQARMMQSPQGYSVPQPPYGVPHQANLPMRSPQSHYVHPGWR